jgi:SAM-dependent methyltransferase
MNLADFQRLLTAPGQAAIAAAAEWQPTEETFLRCLTQLQKRCDAALAKAALEAVILRAKARAKFTRAEAMYFTREALEQASGETIATYRAQRYAGLGRVADVGCGLGGDAIGLAGVARVTVIDKDPLRLALAQANLSAYGRAAESLLADVTVAPLPAADALWFDPARRAESRRAFSVRDYAPPLSIIHEWLARTPALGVKVSPGIELAEIDGGPQTADRRRPPSVVSGLPAHEVEFISVHGELKECVLWFGPLRTEAARRATLLPGPHSLISNLETSTSLSAPRVFLYEPDPAILRAGLVTALAEQLGAHQLDPDIAYLTSDTLTPTPFARAFALDDAFPFQLKRLRAYLRERNVGQVTVKKRGSPLTPEELIRKLKLSGDESRLVFLTHVNGQPYVLIGRAVE